MISKKIQSLPSQNFKKVRFRFGMILMGFFLLFALLGARAFELHFTDNAKLSRLAERQYQRKIDIAPKRGNILDTQGETLAIDIRVESVYATPNLVKDPRALAKALAQALALPENKLLERLKQKDKKFVWIKRRISQKEGETLNQLSLEGIGRLPEYKRFYPNGNLAANLIGAVGLDASALAGLELAFDKVLKSDEPPQLVEQDAKGRSYAPYALTRLERPNQLVLTLDKNIQYIAERELQKAVETAKAKAGFALVLEVSTGDILAMAVSPSFDPNHYSDYPLDHWRNRAVTDLFEPGSTFKAFTAAIGLETGKLKITDKIYCENGSMAVGHNVIHDHHGYGLLRLPEIIKYSSNICSYKIAQKIGREDFLAKIRDFGFGSKTEIAIPGEQAGFLASAESIGNIQLGTIGFGQGISVTPLQLLMAYGALANGGKLMKPRLIREIQDAEGNTLEQFQPEMRRQVVHPGVAAQTLKLLRTVVEKGGTGTKAALDGYSVAGKTGTAQKVIEGAHGYAKNKYIASFIGVSPVQDPKLVVLVSVDEPKGAYYGGLVSAPVFRAIMEQSLAYLKIAPDQDRSEKPKAVVAKKSPAKEKVPVKEIREKDPNSSEAGAKRIPDLTGMTVREVLRRAQEENFQVKINGTGICNRQEPGPGGVRKDQTQIQLECQPPI